MPHRSYLPSFGRLLGNALIKGMAHITGGGITDNLPRMFPAGTHARDRCVGVAGRRQCSNGCSALAAFPMLTCCGPSTWVSASILACAPDREGELIEALARAGEPDAVRIGEIRAGGEGVVYA